MLETFKSMLPVLIPFAILIILFILIAFIRKDK